MESNGNEYHHNHKSGQGFDHLPLTTNADADPPGAREDVTWTSEVMNLAFTITKISADVYEIIADIADYDWEPSNEHGTTENPVRQRQLAALLKIVEATKTTEMRLWSLDSQAIAERPEILEKFLENCWNMLTAFRGVYGRLAEIIGLDSWGKPSSTTSETLLQIMNDLQTCSDIISKLPVSGLAVSYECLAYNALNLQRRAGKLIEKAASLN